MSNRHLTRVGGAVVTGFLLLVLAAPAAADEFVNWINPTNVVLNDGILQKVAGCQGCADAGAISRQTIATGDGFVQVTPGESTTFWYAALTRPTNLRQPADFDFAFRFNGAGHADVVEHGVYRGGDSDYTAGDVFRIAIVNGRVQYVVNGRVLYESPTPPQYPLELAVSLGTVGATVRNARIETRGEYESTPSGTGSRYDDEYSDGYGPVIYVDPTQRWIDTGLAVRAGDTIAFDARGTVRLSSDSNDVADPFGSHVGRRAADAPLPDASAGALIGRIGNNVILVGNSRTLRQSPYEGRLYLGVNDDYLEDNAGSYTVHVVVGH